MGRKLSVISMLIIFTLLCLAFAIALPEGADISRHESSRHENATVKTMSGGLGALAGNVTMVNITAEAVTRTWAGYFGNVSGTLVLQSSGGSNLYSWAMTSPGGKVFASNSTIPDWTEVYCWNISTLGTEGLTQPEWNTKYGAITGDYDNISNTFDATYVYETFYVGNKEFAASGANDNSNYLCPASRLYNESGAKGTDQYEEVILQNAVWGATNNDPPLIYVALIEAASSGLGFDGRDHDFQMMVPDDGHGTDSTVSTYYFYVELESS